MVAQRKDFHGAVPYGLAFEGLSYKNRFDPSRTAAVEITDCFLESFRQLVLPFFRSLRLVRLKDPI